jgi:hypothetical protein
MNTAGRNLAARCSWIPAFAGMTGGEGSGQSRQAAARQRDLTSGPSNRPCPPSRLPRASATPASPSGRSPRRWRRRGRTMRRRPPMRQVPRRPGEAGIAVIPAKAGIHEHGGSKSRCAVFMDSGLRRNDGRGVANPGKPPPDSATSPRARRSALPAFALAPRLGNPSFAERAKPEAVGGPCGEGLRCDKYRAAPARLG